MSTQTSFIDMLLAVEVELIRSVIAKCWKAHAVVEHDMVKKAFKTWCTFTSELRKLDQAREAKTRFFDTLKNSTRGQRSTMEKEIIRRFITQVMTCIPKTVTFSEMDTLCNEIDFIPYVGRSILFLQV